MPCPDETTAKEGSPGPVDGAETIVHILFDPENFQDGQLIGGMSVKRLKKAEFSVARGEMTTVQKIRSAVVDKRLEKNDSISFVGAVKVNCQVVRDLLHTSQGDRIFCVVDDPILEDDYSTHAIVRFSDATKNGYWSRNDAAAALGSLLEAFSQAGAPLPLEACLLAEAA